MLRYLLPIMFILFVNIDSFAQNALSFDGENDFIQTEYSGVLGTQNRTFEAWAFILSTDDSPNMAILDYGLNQAGSRNTFGISPSDQGLRFISGGNYANMISPVGVVPNEEWVHVAFVLKDSIGYMYVNGEEVDVDTLSNVDTPVGQSVRIGQRVPGGNIPFWGGLDEIRIWDIARTQEEIKEYMNVEICEPMYGLTLYMRFNQGDAGGDNSSESFALDDSGNNYTGELQNFSLEGNGSNWVEGTSITYNSINTIVEQNGLTLTAEATDVEYQWINCADMSPIEGEVNQSFTASEDGEYAVILRDNICELTSECFTIMLVDTEALFLQNTISIFPNPTTSEVIISTNQEFQNAEVIIRDAIGEIVNYQEIENQKEVRLMIEGPAGFYTVEIISGKEKLLRRLVKI